MSSPRHHSSATHAASGHLSRRHDTQLPPALIAALAPRLATAAHLRDTALTQLHDARASDGRRFALHVLAPHIVRLAGDARRLAAALTALPTLPGLTIPAMDWIAEHDDVVCYATAWHDGIPVAMTARADVPAASHVAAAARELCRELEALHHRGMTHGMIVPSTLAYSAEEQRFVLEATGVMTALRHCGVSAASAHASCGSSAFAAPELAHHAGHDGGDVRADMFGLGGTLYQLLTGSPPFGGRTTAMVMATVLLDPRTSESAGPASTAVTDVILRCLEKDPADRWADFTAMRDALGAALRHAQPATRGGTPAEDGWVGRVSHAIASRLRGAGPGR